LTGFSRLLARHGSRRGLADHKWAVTQSEGVKTKGEKNDGEKTDGEKTDVKSEKKADGTSESKKETSTKKENSAVDSGKKTSKD